MVGSGVKRKVGNVVIKPLMTQMKNGNMRKQKDWIMNSLMLLLALAINVEMANAMKEAGWDDVSP
eukprot:9443812-Pyramimonas_sp.AAC.1